MLHEVVHNPGRERSKLSRNGKLMTLPRTAIAMPEAQLNVLSPRFRFDLCQCRDDEINRQDRAVVTATVVPG